MPKFTDITYPIADNLKDAIIPIVQDGENRQAPSTLFGSGDIVIYDNASGENEINDIALEIGATYEIFTTSAVDGTTQCGQQGITIKLIPAETTGNSYSLYVPVNYFDVSERDCSTSFIHIYQYAEMEFWNIEGSQSIPPKVFIYKIVKKAV